jgi:TPR repeat protein
MYEDTPYENFFDGKLYKILLLICSTGVPNNDFSQPTDYNYHVACTRVGYWYYQHGDSKLAWELFSGRLKNRMITESEEVIKFKYLNLKPKDIDDILDNLQAQMELSEGLDDYVLYILGKSYYEGVSEEEPVKKVKRRVEEHGSCGNEGLKTRANVIIKQDYSKVLYFLEKSAEKGNCDAQYHLGRMYHHGFGVKVDLGRAGELYDKAATGNEKYANKIGMVYHCEGELHDISKAVECYGKSGKYADRNNVSGLRYLFGTGVEKDYKKAIECFKRYVDTTTTYLYLGFAYYNGPDGIHDYFRAFQLFQRAVELKPDDEFKRTLC